MLPVSLLGCTHLYLLQSVHNFSNLFFITLIVNGIVNSQECVTLDHWTSLQKLLMVLRNTLDRKYCTMDKVPVDWLVCNGLACLCRRQVPTNS